jgi:nucleoside-diphosphate-sugar epimerase
MAIFITGATGYIGQKLAMHLADNGQTIHALVRDLEKGRSLLKHPNIKLFEGDILNTNSIAIALKDCTQVYHLAALASVWHKNPKAFYQINVGGLKNVLESCLKANITHIVFTSTAGVVGDSIDGKPVAENTNSNPKLETLYEQSKLEAESVVREYNKKGLHGIIVNPSRVYGPGLLTESNGFTRVLKMYLNGKWKVKPSNGQNIGNYVYIDDVINGLIYAMEKAKPGERYLLGGIDISYQGFFDLVNQLTGTERTLRRTPLAIMLLAAHIQLFLAEKFGRKPLVIPSFVRKYNKDWLVTSEKAENELGYTITPLENGLKATLQWLETQS